MKRTFGLLALLVVLSLSCAMPSTGFLPAEATPAIQPGAQDPRLANTNSLADLYARVNPGVVAIHVYQEETESFGSGIVVDSEGHIITNLHVVDQVGREGIEVDFPSGFMTMATLVAEDPDSDLAVLRVDAPASELYPLPLGDSDLMRVGDPVIAIGNPFGLTSTMTLGIVSAKGRTLDSQRETPGGTGSYFATADMIQTDAAINPGNSGGPLLNLQGEVVGVIRSIVSQTTIFGSQPTNSGVSFAISSNVIRRVLPSLIANGRYDYPYMGVTTISALTLRMQQLLNLPSGFGVYVIGVAPGSPADKAGIRAGSESIVGTDVTAGGDMIVAMNGQEVRNFSEMYLYLFYHTVPGDTVTVTVLRDGERLDLPLTVASRPD